MRHLVASGLCATLFALVPLGACSTPSRSAFDVPPAPTPLVAGGSAAPVPASAGPLTVDAAARLALTRNPDLEGARASIQGAQAGLAAARASRNPVVSGDVSFLLADAPSAYLFKHIDARNLAPNTNFNDPGTFYNVEAGATLRWNLWDGGRTRLGVWAAEAGVRATCSQHEAVKNSLLAGVVAAFLGAGAAEELLLADDASVKTVEAQVEEIRKKVDAGRVLRSDLLSLEVRLAEARERRIHTDVARRLSLATLRRLLALPAGFELTLDHSPCEPRAFPATWQDALVDAYRYRPEVRAARSGFQRARIQLEQARRAHLPSVDLHARTYGDDEGLSLSHNWTIAVALSFDLFDGGRRRAQVEQARAGVKQLAAQDRKALVEVAADVETSYLRLEEARARCEVATQAVGAADESLELVEKQYAGGSATITRYLAAESARTQARRAKISARLNREQARVNVRRALGLLGREEWR